MTHSPHGPTRRQLLAGIGTVGLVTATARAGSLFGPNFTRYTYAQGPDERELLRVAWLERYNGEFRHSQLGTANETSEAAWNGTDTATYVDDFPNAPVVLPLENVMPGDSGLILIGLATAEGGPVRVWLKPELRIDTENVLTEPEVAAGDTTTDAGSDGAGELDEAITLTMWHDVGLFSNGFVGACDGSLMGEPRILGGTLDALELQESYANDDAVPSDGFLLELGPGGDGSCLVERDQQCIGVRWELPADFGNLAQTDSVQFALTFAATECEELSNPFASFEGEQ